MHSSTRKAQALELRERGYSYSLISERTGIAKATLSDWLSQVPYQPNEKVLSRIGRARANAGARHAEMKRESYKNAKEEALKDLGTFTRRDLRMFGLGLYLGEGAKTMDAVRIVNADPSVIALAVAWFKLFGIAPHQFAPRIHLYPDTNIQRANRYWANVLGVPVSQMQRAYVDAREDKKSSKKGKLPHGTLHLSVRSGGKKEYGVFFFRKIQAMNAEILRTVCGRGLPV